MTNAFLLSDVAGFRDEWHDCAATSTELASILSEQGITSLISESPEQLPTDTSRYSLVVVNVGTGFGEVDGIVRRLARFSSSGGAVLAVHGSAVGLGTSAAWRALIGGTWVREHSWHPDEGVATVNTVDLASGSPRHFTVFDEMYSDLTLNAEPRPIAWHSLEQQLHPLAWLIDATPSHGRAAYSALGHSVRAYESSGHRQLIADVVGWLTEGRP